MTFKALIRGCLAAAAISVATPASAELFEGCPSKPILGKFIEFGRSGKMPKKLGKWLKTPSAQKVDPGSLSTTSTMSASAGSPPG